MRLVSIALAGILLSSSASAISDTIVGNNIPDFSYDSITGKMSVNTDGAQLNSILISSQALSTVFTTNSLNPVNAAEWLSAGVDSFWVQDYFNTKEQWLRIEGARLNTAGNYLELATYATGLSLGSFGDVEYSYRVGAAGAATGYTAVSAVPEPTTLGLIFIVGAGLMARQRKAV